MGFFGWYSTIVEWLDRAVIAGAIAGVGIILTEVGASYIKQKPTVAGPSTLVGVLAYLVTEDLTIVIVAAVAVGTLIHHFLPARFRVGQGDEGPKQEEQREQKEEEDGGGKGEFGLMPFHWKDMVAVPVLIGAFSVMTLRMGTVLSYGTVNAGLADQDPELDGVMLMAGLSSLGSALMGGPPVEATPGPTAGAPQPVASTVLYLGLMAGIALFGLIEKTGKWVPLEAVAGFLVTLGILVVLPEQLPYLTDAVVPGGTALVVTALTSNPFYGVVAGEAMVYLKSLGFVELGG